jgi:hypothetical protein
MKKSLSILLALALFSCSSTRFVDSWRNEDLVSDFRPENMLVLAITDNLTARQIFEEELSSALRDRSVQAQEAYGALDTGFAQGRLDEAELDQMAVDLSDRGYDAVMITSVKGVEQHHQHVSGTGYTYDYYGRFGRYYYRYQDIYYVPQAIREYQVFHVETVVYELDGDAQNQLVWVGSFDITDPISIRDTVDDYVKSLMNQLDNEGIIR